MDASLFSMLSNAFNTRIGNLFNLGRSIAGGVALNKLKGQRPVAPTYEIPPAVRSYLTQKYLQSQQDLPGRDIIESQIGSQVAGTIGDVNKAASSSAAALGAVTDVRQRAMDAIRDLGVRAAEYRAQKQAEATDAQRYLADYQEKEWEYNENLPYQRKMNEFNSKRNAALQNLWGGLEGIGSSTTQGIGNMSYQMQMQELIDAMRGTGATQPTASTYNPSSSSIDWGRINAPNLSGYPSWQAYQLSQNMGG